MLTRLTSDVHTSEVNDVHAHTKDAHDAYEISGERTIPCLIEKLKLLQLNPVFFFSFLHKHKLIIKHFTPKKFTFQMEPETNITWHICAE